MIDRVESQFSIFRHGSLLVDERLDHSIDRWRFRYAVFVDLLRVNVGKLSSRTPYFIAERIPNPTTPLRRLRMERRIVVDDQGWCAADFE